MIHEKAEYPMEPFAGVPPSYCRPTPQGTRDQLRLCLLRFACRVKLPRLWRSVHFCLLAIARRVQPDLCKMANPTLSCFPQAITPKLSISTGCLGRKEAGVDSNRLGPAVARLLRSVMTMITVSLWLGVVCGASRLME